MDKDKKKKGQGTEKKSRSVGGLSKAKGCREMKPNNNKLKRDSEYSLKEKRWTKKKGCERVKSWADG